jgi:RNA polymerase sigma-70 factor (ECF subfamily)
MTLDRQQFDEACRHVRPDLHRFCTRMLGNPWDGEDVLQDALVQAFYHVDELRDPAALRPWLFQIAHHRCIDRLRLRRPFEPLDDDLRDQEPAMPDQLADRQRASRALTTIVTRLPPRERACVVLADVLGMSLDETASITDTTVGSVKAALHRGRDKLEAADAAPANRLAPRDRAIVERYLAAFNARDWTAVLALLGDDARLEVVGVAEGRFADACYFINYGKLPRPWRLALALVDGVEAIVQFREIDGAWRPHAIVRIDVEGDQIMKIRDYTHVDYVLADSVVVEIR